MSLIFLITLTFILFLSFIFALNNTIFCISFKRANFSGLLIAKEIFIFVVIGIYLFELYGVSGFYTFYMSDETIANTSYIIFYALIVLFLTIGFVSKFLFRRYLYLRGESALDINIGNIKNSLFLVLLLLLTFFIAMGLKHSFIHSIFMGGSLIDIRLSNRYSNIPTVLISFYNFVLILFIVFVGYNFKQNDAIFKIFYILTILFFSSFFGGKAPVINSLILLYFSYLSSFNSIKFNFRFFSKIIIVFILIASLMVLVIKVQFPDANIINFFIDRIGVGQIHGAYEQFALKLSKPDYIYHTIPFANFFFTYTPFNKDLMMHTWGYYLDGDSVGVMNSLFIGEALAIGGYPLVFFSPLIVAINYCSIAFLLVFVLNKFYKISLLDSKKIGGLVIVSYSGFTGDIAGLLFFKSFVMVAFLLFFLYFFYLIFKLLKNRLV